MVWSPVRPYFQPLGVGEDILPNQSSQRDSIALAFELLTPRQVCAAFHKALHRPVSYTYSPTIDISVPIPEGYHAQLEGIESLFGRHAAPYFGPEITAPEEARSLWPGWRGIEEYAREVFPVEEAANGMVWMHEVGRGNYAQ